MQILPLKLNHTSFYCPVTGESLLFSDDYHSSPATLFQFIAIEGGRLVDPKPEIEVLYNEALEEINKGLYIDYEFKYYDSNEAKAFEILVYEKLKEENNYVLFEICTTGLACGPTSSTLYIGIDMNYQTAAAMAEENDFEFELYFPNFDDYETVLLESTKTTPTLNGYALFMEDSMGCGGFYFFNTDEEWETLLPALVFLDYVNQNKEAIPTEQLKCILKVYFDYFNSGIYDKLPELFTPDLNELLEDYTIIFFGKTTELFEPNSEFTTELIESFGNNPNERKEYYLGFLTKYCKI